MKFPRESSDISIDMNIEKVSYYRNLPKHLSWSGVRILSRREAWDILPRASLLPFRGGMFSSVFSGQLGTAIKRERMSADLGCLLLDNEDSLPSLSHYEGQQLNNLLGSASKREKADVLTAFLKAKRDDDHFEALSLLFSQNMVEQSIALVLGKTIMGRTSASRVMIQPLLDGITLSNMIPLYAKLTFIPRISAQHIETFRSVSGNLRRFVDSGLADENPDNFIITPDGHLVYVDYQAALKNPVSHEFLVSLLKRYGD